MAERIIDAKDAVEWLRRPGTKRQLDRHIKNKDTRRAIEILLFFGGAMVHAVEFPFDAVVAMSDAFEEELMEVSKENE